MRHNGDGKSFYYRLINFQRRSSGNNFGAHGLQKPNLRDKQANGHRTNTDKLKVDAALANRLKEGRLIMVNKRFTALIPIVAKEWQFPQYENLF